MKLICNSPFVQRVWIALEYKGVPYKYVELDPYAKPPELLDVNPRGLVPALRHGDWGCHESTVLLEYVEERWPLPSLLPPHGKDPQRSARSRLWADHINRNVIPLFYRLLQAQEEEKQVSSAKEMREQLKKLIDAAHGVGPFFDGDTMGWVDVMFAPWMLRFRRVLRHYRGWPDAGHDSRWAVWLHAVEDAACVAATTSDDELYLDSYARYAGECPQLALIREGGKELMATLSVFCLKRIDPTRQRLPRSSMRVEGYPDLRCPLHVAQLDTESVGLKGRVALELRLHETPLAQLALRPTLDLLDKYSFNLHHRDYGIWHPSTDTSAP